MQAMRPETAVCIKQLSYMPCHILKFGEPWYSTSLRVYYCQRCRPTPRRFFR